MSERQDKLARHSAERAQARARRQQGGNVQYVRRVPEVNGTAYTEGMSEAYWRGMQDGESTAARMVRRADPKNVRVRALAVMSDEPEEQGIAVIDPQVEDGQLALMEEQTAVAVIEPEDNAGQMALPETGKSTAPARINSRNDDRTGRAQDEGLPIIGLKTRETLTVNTANAMKTNEINQIADNASRQDAETVVRAAENTPNVTYALRSDKITDARYSAGSAGSKKKSSAFGRVGSMLTGITARSVGKKSAADASASGYSSDTPTVQPWKEMSLLRKVVIILSVILFIYAFSPLLVLGIFNVGTIPLALIALFFFTVSLLWDHIESCENRVLNTIYAAAAVVVILGIIGMAFISGKMIGASLRTPPEDLDNVTVVVLGCLVIDDQPSLMLERRLETAAEYLLSNPHAHCVVTGGQGENEDHPEAVVMKNYLVAAGVEEERIIVEQNSTSTVENLEFAAELIDKYNCHEDVVIVSDRFHQYRASLAAKDAGLNSYALSCETAWYLVAHYWFREMAGIAQIWLMG